MLPYIAYMDPMGWLMNFLFGLITHQGSTWINMELAPQAKTKIAYGEELLVGGLNWG
jgi:hypothetical protein